MPRKPSSVAPAVRIRENQRRARVRRKELIDELKSKVRECELHGATATIEMQRAARKVLSENRRLRALLAEKGVSAAEVEASLRGKGGDPSPTGLPSPELADIATFYSRAAPLEDHQQLLNMCGLAAMNQPGSAVSPPSTPSFIALENTNQAETDSQHAVSPDDAERSQLGEDLDREAPPPNLGPVSDCFCPEIEPVPSQASASETECSVAANILAEFRGHGDVQRARVELACPDNDRCSIPNVALLDALDTADAGDN